MNPDQGGEQEGGVGVGGNEGIGDADDANEKDAALSFVFVSFSSEKETKEPWPPHLLSLGDVMMDPEK